MNIKELVPVDWANQRVLTTKQIAEFYGVSTYRIKDNFRNAREHFKEGVHYFKVVGSANLRQLRGREGCSSLVGKSASMLILWTCQGCARHAKMLNASKAWEVFNLLEASYFGQNAGAAPTAAEASPDEELAQLRTENVRLRNQLPHLESSEFAVVYALLMSNGTVKIGYTANLTERRDRPQRKIRRLRFGRRILRYSIHARGSILADENVWTAFHTRAPAGYSVAYSGGFFVVNENGRAARSNRPDVRQMVFATVRHVAVAQSPCAASVHIDIGAPGRQRYGRTRVVPCIQIALPCAIHLNLSFAR